MRKYQKKREETEGCRVAGIVQWSSNRFTELDYSGMH